MSTTTQIEGYKNFEDCDEFGFAGPKPSDQAVTSALHTAIDMVDGERWVISRLDEVLEEALTWPVRKALRNIRLAQVKNVERCEALIAELTREHLRHSEESAPAQPTLPGKEGMT